MQIRDQLNIGKDRKRSFLHHSDSTLPEPLNVMRPTVRGTGPACFKCSSGPGRHGLIQRGQRHAYVHRQD